jgi:hypothetical protein
VYFERDIIMEKKRIPLETKTTSRKESGLPARSEKPHKPRKHISALQHVNDSPIDMIDAENIAVLQRTIGNRAVGQLLKMKSVQRQADECGPRGPSGEESPNPLIYHYLEARAKGLSETARSKRPAVGYAQRQLNQFLYDIDTHGAEAMEDNASLLQLRNSLSPRYLKVDCWFGSETKKATILFQRMAGLKPDGRIGENTWPVLESIGSAQPVCPAEVDTVQTALSMGTPGDPYEQEAEKVSTQVASFYNSIRSDTIQHTLIAGTDITQALGVLDAPVQKISRISNSAAKRLEASLHVQADAPQRDVSPNVEHQITRGKGKGHPLPSLIQNTMAVKTGYNFDNVRVKQDNDAAELNRTLNARAFTHGSDIWLGKNESVHDMGLMSHELTHVVQQGAVQKISKKSPSSLNGMVSNSSVKDHLNAVRAGNVDSALYRKGIAHFQNKNSTDRIAALQNHILEVPSRVSIQQKSNSQVIRFCAACTPAQKTFSKGDILGIKHGFKSGWILGKLESAGGKVVSLPDYLKVEYDSLKGGRDHFKILEGPHQGETASLKLGHLDKRSWKSKATVEFKEDTSRTTPTRSYGECVYNNGTKADAIITVRPGDRKITKNRTYNLKLPDYPHSGNYGDYSSVWFRIAGGPQGDEYHHRGSASLGCVTVTANKWPTIYQHLINSRKSTQHVGTIKRT